MLTRFRLSAVLAALALLVPGCGGDSGAGSDPGDPRFADVFAAVDGLSGQARTDRLLELVEEEGGELSLYISLPSRVLDDVVGAFEDAYDVDVAVYRASSEVVSQRVVEEADAGFRGADVVHVAGNEIEKLARADLLVPYESEHLARLPEGAHTGDWTAVSAVYLVLGRNTDLVPESEAPREWEDLADPRWKGTIALDPTGIDLFKGLWDHWARAGKSDDEIRELFGALAANGVFVNGHTLAFQLVAAGEFALHPGPTNAAAAVARDGAPLGWLPATAPTFVFEAGEGLVEGARHPAAAVLFLDWILTDGQAVLGASGLGPITGDPPAGLGELAVVDFESLLADLDTWTSRFERFVAGGRVYEGGD